MQWNFAYELKLGLNEWNDDGTQERRLRDGAKVSLPPDYLLSMLALSDSRSLRIFMLQDTPGMLTSGEQLVQIQGSLGCIRLCSTFLMRASMNEALLSVSSLCHGRQCRPGSCMAFSPCKPCLGSGSCGGTDRCLQCRRLRRGISTRLTSWARSWSSARGWEASSPRSSAR